MIVKVSADPVDMSTLDHNEEKIDIMYEPISKILDQEGRGKVNPIILGDVNSVVVEGCKQKIVGEHGIGIRSDMGKMLIDICQGQKTTV